MANLISKDMNGIKILSAPSVLSAPQWFKPFSALSPLSVSAVLYISPRNALMVSDEYLNRIKTLRPKIPHYMDRHYRDDGQLLADWNLIVPVDILQKIWEEIR